MGLRLNTFLEEDEKRMREDSHYTTFVTKLSINYAISFRASSSSLKVSITFSAYYSCDSFSLQLYTTENFPRPIFYPIS